LELLNQIPDWEKSTIFLPGAGTSVLIEALLSDGVKLVLNDISIEALNRVKDRLNDKDREIVWLCQDIAQPIQGTMPDVDIWIEWAVSYFNYTYINPNGDPRPYIYALYKREK
jgi:hypothetical protein